MAQNTGIVEYVCFYRRCVRTPLHGISIFGKGQPQPLIGLNNVVRKQSHGQAVDALFLVHLYPSDMVTRRGTILGQIKIDIVSKAVAVTPTIAWRSFPPVRLRAVVSDDLDTAVGLDE